MEYLCFGAKNVSLDEQAEEHKIYGAGFFFPFFYLCSKSTGQKDELKVHVLKLSSEIY